MSRFISILDHSCRSAGGLFAESQFAVSLEQNLKKSLKPRLGTNETETGVVYGFPLSLSFETQSRGISQLLNNVAEF